MVSDDRARPCSSTAYKVRLMSEVFSFNWRFTKFLKILHCVYAPAESCFTGPNHWPVLCGSVMEGWLMCFPARALRPRSTRPSTTGT